MGKGSMKILITVALIALLAGSWYTMFSDAKEKENKYISYIETAKEKAEKELYDEAFTSYRAALQMRDSLELREEIADLYYEIGHYETYLGFCEETITEYPYDADAYERMADLYKENRNYEHCFDILNKAVKRGIVSKNLEKIREEIQYQYEYVYYGYSEVSIFSNDLCAVKDLKDRWAYTSLDGKLHIGFRYLNASDYTGQYMAVQLESGQYAFVDSTGREKSKDVEKKEIEDCLFYYEDKIAVKYDGKYHYCDFEFNKLFGDFDYAGTYSGGIAVAMNDGKWFIIDSAGNKVGNKTFEEIKVDEKGVAFRNGVAFAKDNGKYILIDTAGNKVGNGAWEDVDCFNSNQPAAVSNGVRWGYIDTSGNVIMDYKYEKAKSFSNGFAAVCELDEWGYIILDDYSLKVEYQFKDAADFSRSGTAFVKKTDGWDLIKFYSYNQ